MNRLSQLSFRMKISILVFLTTFTFFMGFILIEDLLILKSLYQKTEGWDGTKRSIRVAFGFCFSILTAVLTAFSFNFFYDNLRNLIHFIQSWRADGSREEIQVTRNDEIGSLVRSLQIALYQEDERSEKRTIQSIHKEKNKLSQSIQERINTLPLQKISGLDISMFPKGNRNPANDYIQILKTSDGCLGVLTGFETPGVRESSFKAGIHSLFQFLYLLKDRNGHDSFQAILKGLKTEPVGLLNLSLFHLDHKSGELEYLAWQESPLLIWNENGIRELEKSPSKHVPETDREEESFHSKLEENEWLLIFSDRILKTIHLTGHQFIQELNRRIFEVDPHTANSREITLAIANHISKRYGKKALDRLGLIAIRRTTSHA